MKEAGELGTAQQTKQDTTKRLRQQTNKQTNLGITSYYLLTTIKRNNGELRWEGKQQSETPATKMRRERGFLLAVVVVVVKLSGKQ
jgi:hypothetical protein